MMIGGSGIFLMPINGGDPRPVPGTQPGDVPVRWDDDGQSVLISLRGPTQSEMYRVNTNTGTRSKVQSFKPADSAGINYVSSPILAAEQKNYVFGYSRVLADLFVVDQLK
jgi:hypothetical protein